MRAAVHERWHISSHLSHAMHSVYAQALPVPAVIMPDADVEATVKALAGERSLAASCQLREI